MADDRPTKCLRATLSDDHAWAIATDVAEAIRGHVTVAEAETPEDIGGETYAWLEIRVPALHMFPHPQLRHARAWIANARDVCVVWTMLSRCAGFGGDENALFWKRVIDAVARSGRYTVSDAYAFFPSWWKGSAFPRFRLELPFSRQFDVAIDDEGDDSDESVDEDEDDEEESEENEEDEEDDDECSDGDEDDQSVLGGNDESDGDDSDVDDDEEGSDDEDEDNETDHNDDENLASAADWFDAVVRGVHGFGQ